MGMGFGYSVMGSIIPLFFVVIFALIVGAFIVAMVKGIGQWRENNASPVLTVDATVVSKRMNTTHHTSGDAETMHSHSDTTYYTTFQVESGDRLEFHVSGQEYGLLVEGDQGRLTFQGTRYQGFERQR